MKKIILLMLLSVSSLSLSQNTVTRNIPESQIPEIYKGLKQSDYLKLRLQKTDAALNSAVELNHEQEKALLVSKNLLKSKDEIIATHQEIYKFEKTASIERENQLKSDVLILESEMKIIQETSKIKQRKKFWNGVKIGGISVAVIGVAGLLIIK